MVQVSGVIPHTSKKSHAIVVQQYGPDDFVGYCCDCTITTEQAKLDIAERIMVRMHGTKRTGIIR